MLWVRFSLSAHSTNFKAMGALGLWVLLAPTIKHCKFQVWPKISHHSLSQKIISPSIRLMLEEGGFPGWRFPLFRLVLGSFKYLLPISAIVICLISVFAHV